MKFRAAIAFFSRIPVGSAPLPDNFDGILAWFPVVGLLIGALVASVMGIFSLFIPPMLCGFIGCLAWTFITGGLHLDGVADCGDGLTVETTPERRLEIMQDSRLGTFGGAALFFVLSAKTLALTTLSLQLDIANNFSNILHLILFCASAAALGRCMNFVAIRLPSARANGLGEAMRKGLNKKHFSAVFLLGLFLCILNGLHGLIILIFISLLAYFLLSTAKKRIGGVTGDVLGCLTETTECAVLIAVCI